MADYWKSLPRKFCEFCKCWITDNRPSVEFHERGRRHKDNVEKKLTALRKKGKKDFEAKKKLESVFRKMNDAAMQAMQKDIERDPSLARELEASKETSTSEPPKPVQAQMSSKNKQAKGKGQRFKGPKMEEDDIYAEVGPSDPAAPYGQWVTVDNSVPTPVDLQLPEQKDVVEFKVVIETKEPKLKVFKEKTVTSMSGSNSSSLFETKSTEVTFKKRKLGMGLRRNVRKKDDNDSDD